MLICDSHTRELAICCDLYLSSAYPFMQPQSKPASGTKIRHWFSCPWWEICNAPDYTPFIQKSEGDIFPIRTVTHNYRGFENIYSYLILTLQNTTTFYDAFKPLLQHSLDNPSSTVTLKAHRSEDQAIPVGYQSIHNGCKMAISQDSNTVCLYAWHGLLTEINMNITDVIIFIINTPVSDILHKVT